LPRSSWRHRKEIEEAGQLEVGPRGSPAHALQSAQLSALHLLCPSLLTHARELQGSHRRLCW
jgi:hypothetical protein